MATQKIVKKIYKNWQEYLIYGSWWASIEVDSALSDSSENPVQNKVVKWAIDAKISNPSGWSAWQYLKKTSNWEAWADVDALPSGWTAWQVLTKTQNWADWEDPTWWIISSNDTYEDIVHLSQSDYDNLQTKDPNTLYSTPEDETEWFVVDSTFWSSWDWVTDKAPSMNAIYDVLWDVETLLSNI